MPDTRGKYCYLTRGFGDPPRTYDKKQASRYKTMRAAKIAMTKAKKTSPFKDRDMFITIHPLDIL